jgi:hypothetical protein
MRKVKKRKRLTKTRSIYTTPTERPPRQAPTSKVEQATDGTWRVIGPAGDVIADGLSNSRAWHLADERDHQANKMDEKHRRIGVAIGQW